MQLSSEQYTTISSSLLSDCSASRVVAKLMEPGICFAWYAHSASAITRRKSSLRSNFCFNSSRLIVFILHSFSVLLFPLSLTCKDFLCQCVYHRVCICCIAFVCCIAVLPAA